MSKWSQMIPKWSLNDAQMLSKWCPNDVQMMSKCCPNDVQMMTKWCPNDVQMMSTWCPNDVQMMSKWCLRACTMIIVHACTMIKACMYYDHSTCISIIVEHVSCPTRLMFREIEDGGSGGRSPPGKQGGLGGARPPNVEITLLNCCWK